MKDFLKECNNLGVPEEDFRNIWCIRCVQQDCVRSHRGKSKFEARVATWEERLFTKIPRMAETDPRYPVIAGQQFIEPERWKPALVQVPSSWDPPTDAPPEPLPAEPLPTGFVGSRVPHQSGKTLGEIVRPGARIRLGGPKEPVGDGSGGVR